jgi:DNA-binding transcriptional regulator YhcF (GntR family)
MKGENMVDKVKNKMLEESMTRFLEEMHALGLTSEEIVKQLEKQIKKGGAENGTAHS